MLSTDHQKHKVLQKLLTTGALLSFLALSSCASINPVSDATVFYRTAARTELEPIQKKEAVDPGIFLEFYKNEFLERMQSGQNYKHYIGYVDSGDYTIFTHVLTPESAASFRGTVFIFHGFATDSSRYTALSKRLLQNNWIVVLADLPGHGLSGGESGAADDFTVYGNTVAAVSRSILPHVQKPFVAIGHSTGALALMDFSMHYDQVFDRIVFYAPLVRTAYWPLLRSVRFLSKPFIHSLKTNSHSPLGVRIFPVDWFDALVRWQKEARKETELGMPPLLVIQGKDDSVVGNRYNRRFIKNRTQNTEFRLVEGADHFELDSKEPEEAVLTEILSFIEQ